MILPTTPVLAHLGRYGPRTAPELVAALGVSRSALQRAIESVRDQVLVVGRARSTRYAARRSVDGVRTPVAVYEVDASGDARHVLTLHPVAPFGHYVEGHVAEVEGGFHGTSPAEPGPDLPWFLQHALPTGFFGRGWLRAHPDQGYPVDLTRWTGDHGLRFAADHGTDLVGALVVGPVARDRVLERADDGVDEHDVAGMLSARAEGALAKVTGGSSPGGEQPKFTLRVRSANGEVRWELVKFSPPLSTPAGRRWADLLVSEALATEVLRARGVEACEAAVVDAGDRRFLRAVRFDRHGAVGRSGVVALAPLDLDGVANDLSRWSLVTGRLVREGRLSAADHERVLWLEAFGHHIANTDMHLGNLSLRLHGTTITGLAPVYDMLPMAYAPRHGGELPDPAWRQPILADGPADARAAAQELWVRVAADRRVSDDFRAIAADHARRR